MSDTKADLKDIEAGPSEHLDRIAMLSHDENDAARQEADERNATMTSSLEQPVGAGAKQGQNDSESSSIASGKGDTNGQTQKLRPWSVKAIRAHLDEIVSHEESIVPLAWQSFLTGAIDALVYAKASVWTGYQTGNMVQISQNIAQYILPQAAEQRNALQTTERAVSIVAFVVGSFVAARIAKRIGERKRLWLVTSSLLQSLLLWGAAGILLSRPKDEEPSFQWYPAVIMFTSFSFGMQSLTAQKMASPAWATTVAYTATLTQIASDPYISALLPSAQTRGRDLRLLSIVMLCFGAGVAECWLYSDLGYHGAMALCAGFKILLALLWLIPKGSR